MAKQLITERFALAGGKVDREAGVIRGAVICGLKSENGRDYEWGGRLKGSHAVYEGAVTNCDHGKDDTVDRRFGWWQDVQPGEAGKPVGDFHMLKSHPMYERVMEAAEKNPRLYGFSHVIEAQTSRKNGREIVESISRVVSIDLVAVPATTKSLFESTGGAIVTLRELIESLRAKLPAPAQAKARKLLLVAEDDADMGAMMDVPVDAPAEETDPEQAITDAFRQAMHAQVDALIDGVHTKEEMKSKLHELAKSLDKLTGKPTSDSDTDDSDTDDDSEGDEMPKESKQVKAADMLAECKALAFSPTYEQGEHLCRIADADTRKLVIESFKAAAKVSEAEPPRSRARSEVKTEAKAGDDAFVPTAESLKKRWRE